MISVQLARELRDAGLVWLPQEGDRFVIPDRGLENHVFSISQMTVDVQERPGGRQIAFNGTVEWALDSIKQHEVIWLPSESQLRDRLGRAFRMLKFTDNGYRCTVMFDEATRSYEADDAADAYGLALLELISEHDVHLRLLLDQ